MLTRLHATLLLACVTAITGCSSMRSSYEKATELDTAAAYSRFLTQYPNSPMAAEVTQLLRQKQDELLKDRDRKLAILQSYVLRGTTIGEFLRGGWTPGDPQRGRIGILACQFTEPGAGKCILGTFSSDAIATLHLDYAETDYAWQMMLATYGVFDRQDFSDWFGFSYANGLQVRPWNATVPMLPPMAEPLCMLTFSAGVLDSVGWYDDGQ